MHLCTACNIGAAMCVHCFLSQTLQPRCVHSCSRTVCHQAGAFGGANQARTATRHLCIGLQRTCVHHGTAGDCQVRLGAACRRSCILFLLSCARLPTHSEPLPHHDTVATARAIWFHMGQCLCMFCRLSLLHNNTAAAVDALSEAVAWEDSLGYMEPPR